MRRSSKRLTIVNTVTFCFPWRAYEKCSRCGDHILWEPMYVVPPVNMPDGSFNAQCETYCRQCCKSREQAWDLAVTHQTTARTLAIRAEARAMAQQQLSDAKTVTQRIIEDIMELPDGNVSPCVHSVLVKHTTVEVPHGASQ